MLAELNVHALHANRAARVDHDKANLADTAHYAHGLVALGQHIVLPRPRQLTVQQDRQAYMGHLLQPYRVLRGVTIDNVRICPRAERLR